MREQLGELTIPILRPLLDPRRHASVCPGSIPPRQALVGDVLDQDVAEGELALAHDRGAGSRVDQASVLEPPQDLVQLDRARIRLEQRPNGSDPEGPADDRRRLHDPLLEGHEQIDARGEHALHGVGDLEVLDARRFLQQPLHDLLEEEGVPACALQDQCAKVAREGAALHKQLEELR